MKHPLFLAAITGLLCTSAFANPALDTQENAYVSQEIVKDVLLSFPRTPDQVRVFTEQAMDEFATSLQNFVDIPPLERTFENTVLLWDKIGKAVISKIITLKSLFFVTDSKEAIEAANESFDTLQGFLAAKLLETPEIFFSVLGYLEQEVTSDNLSPTKWLYVHQFANSFPANLFPSPFQEEILALQEAIAAKPMETFLYLKGATENKPLSNDYSFTILNINLCCIPGNFPYIFGGVRPWKERMEGIIEKILSTQSDVICLEEVFEEEAAQQLYEGLKEHYTHFYINIAPQNIGFGADTPGVSSGLFIASKFEIQDPTFTLFEDIMYPMNRGFFDFKIKTENEVLAHIYTTHLDPFATPPGPEFRTLQMTQILEKMKEDLSEGEEPVILCGDLNINWSSGEPAEQLKNDFFYDAYNENRLELDFSNHTYLDFTNFWWKAEGNASKFVKQPEILDYALVLKKEPFSLENEEQLLAGFSNITIETQVVPMNEQEPIKALSDHHGLLSTVKKR